VLKKVTRQVQLVLSVGVAILIIYAVVTSSLILRMGTPNLHAGPLRSIEMALIARGALLIIAPIFCFVTARIIDLNPWGLGFGSAVFVEVAMDFLVWATGELDEPGVLASVLRQFAVTLIAGGLSALAARKALAMARASAAREGAPRPRSEAEAALEANAFAEKMRQAQKGSPGGGESKR
jgi:hypothetical protein